MSYVEKLKELVNTDRDEYFSRVRNMAADVDDIVIYGAGIYGQQLRQLLIKSGFQIKGFCVTNKKYIPDKIAGLEVLSVDKCIHDDKRHLFLIAASSPINEQMSDYLQQHGISQYVKTSVYMDEWLDEAFFRPVVEITSRAGCSVNCRYCPQDIFLKQYFNSSQTKLMDFSCFKTCLEKLPSDCIIDFSGFAEPFLNNECIDMILLASKMEKDIRLYTTLVGLSLKNLKKIENVPFKRVVIHLPDIHQYANIPITDEYLNTLRYAVNRKKQDGTPLVDMANCQDAPNPMIADILDGKIPISWNLIDRAGNLTEENIQSTKNCGKKLYCSRAAMLNHFVLLPNGNLALCCMDYGLKHIIGNIFTNTYEEIMQTLKDNIYKLLKKGSERLLCSQCSAAKIFH